MSSQDDDLKQLIYGLFSPEEAADLLLEVFDSDQSNPEGLVKLLVVLSDNTTDKNIQEGIHYLIRAAFDRSIAHSMAVEDYIAAIREGRNPLEIARAHGQASKRKAGDKADKSNKR